MVWRTTSWPLQNLVEFLRIDPDLIRAAAESSEKTPAQAVSPEDIKKWLAELPTEDKDAILLRLIDGEDGHTGVELRLRAITEIRGKAGTGRELQAGNRRRVGQLVARAEAIAEERRRHEVERRAREKAEDERRAAEQRENYLQALVGKEHYLWANVAKLIATRQPKGYEEAVLLLRDLRDLATRQNTGDEFTRRMAALYQEHARKPNRPAASILSQGHGFQSPPPIGG